MTTEEHREPLSSEVKRLEGEVGPHAHHPLLHLPVFEQLKQRNVIRVGVLYLVVCWLILDPVHVVFHMLDVPAWANRLVLVLMAVGFPAVLIFAWVYEITPGGLKPTVEVPHAESIRKLTGRRLDRAITAVLAVALAYFVIDKFWISRYPASTPVASQPRETSASGAPAALTVPPSVAAFAPPPHSIAVLPFINLSGEQEQEYFSDGLTEELLNSLARINELQVAARTSAFSFKGKDNDIGTIARKLNVGAVLEGSVRRSAHTVRITAQLINGITGFHLWSHSYDRDLGDVLKLQSEIASAVAAALKVTLLGDTAAKIELGGTRHPDAFDAYLHAEKLMGTGTSGGAANVQTAIGAYSEALRLDPAYALALAGRSRALTAYAREYATGPALRENFGKAQADAHRAIELAPDLAEGHLALADFSLGIIDYTRASEEYDRAVALAPGNAKILREYSRFAAWMGRAEAAIAAARRALVLDPLNPRSHSVLGQTLYFSRRNDEAAVTLKGAIRLDPDSVDASGFLGLSEYAQGDFQAARAACETKLDHWLYQWCLAVTYERLGRHADAEAVLSKYQAAFGDAGAYQYATIYAQWGDTARALQCLETAMRLHDPGLGYLKTDPLMDPLRKEPRFQAIEGQLKFPP